MDSLPSKTSGELALFGEDWGTWRGVMVEGSTIFVTAKCVARYGNSNYLDFKISTVEYLQTVKENRLEKFTISIDSSIVDDTLVNDLKTLVDNDEGHAQLFIQIHDSETNTNFTMRAQDRSVGVNYNREFRELQEWRVAIGSGFVGYMVWSLPSDCSYRVRVG